MRLSSPFVFGLTLVLALPSQAQRQIKVETMTTANCRVVDHNGTTGDDSGGIAVSSQKVYYNGDSAAGEFNLTDLGGARRVTGAARYSMISNLANGKLYALWNRQANRAVATSTVMSGAMFDGLKELDANLNPTQNMINLSQGINLPRASGSQGHLLLAGFDAVGIGVYNGRWYVIDLTDGQVRDVGPRGTIRAYFCETWAQWGVLEYFDDQWYALFRTYPAQTMSRVNLSTGQGGAVFNFTRLGDMCSLTVSPTTQKWYFHHEGTSQFGGGSETIGSCDAQIITNSPPLWSVPEPMTVYAGQMLRANISVVEADGDEMDVTVRGMPDGAIWNQLAGKFRWQPTAEDAGEHVVRFSAQEVRNDDEEALVGSAEFVINVVALNEPPQFSSAPPVASIPQGDEFVYQLFAADPESAGPVSYGLLDGPASMVIEGSTLRWVADERPGSEVPVRIFAADVEGNRGYQSFTLGVDTHPQAPVAVIVSQEAERGPGRIQLSGVPSYSMGDRTLTYKWLLTAFPEAVMPPPVEGSSLAIANVLLRFKGAYSFSLQVSDGQLDSAVVTTQITVVNVPPVAVPGEDVTFQLSEGGETELVLDGSGSYDPNQDDTMSCTWAQTEGPDVSIEDVSSLSTKFRAFGPSTYVFSLTCTDGELESEAAEVRFVGSDPNEGSPGNTRPPALPDEGCSATGVSTWLLFGLVALRRRRRQHRR